MNLFEKLKEDHLFKDPHEHIYAKHIVELKLYDSLYEHQIHFDGNIWNKFKDMYNIKCKFLDDITDIDLTKEVLCLWFFKERSDRDGGGNDLSFKDKKIVYHQNTFFITTSTDIKVLKRKKFFPRRPCLQIELSAQDYVNIKKDLEK